MQGGALGLQSLLLLGNDLLGVGQSHGKGRGLVLFSFERGFEDGNGRARVPRRFVFVENVVDAARPSRCRSAALFFFALVVFESGVQGGGGS